uniref:Serine protease n=1 Tax=uncultured bacterium esnapd15 TaxID=1366595 RepID=S5UBN8_9BACT|nr:serine protease [uncultured bacterium esnapd15]
MLSMAGATGATVTTPFSAEARRATLTSDRGLVPADGDPRDLFSYLPLTSSAATRHPAGRRANLDVPGRVFNDATYTRVGIPSNGYLVAGGDGADRAVPGPGRSGRGRRNNITAPFWADLDGTACWPTS